MWKFDGNFIFAPIDTDATHDLAICQVLPAGLSYGDLLAAAPDMKKALVAAETRLTDDHDCLDCGNPENHDEDCIVLVIQAALGKSARGNVHKL